jgi:hypothetical protein
MNEPCLTCGHGRAFHQNAVGAADRCHLIDYCTCPKFEPAGNTGPPPVAISFEPDEPVEKIVAAFEAGSKGATGPPSDPTGAVAGPPDLHQAIQAATTALCDQHPAIGLSDPWAQVARIAVEAAASVLLQAIRDRLADLKVYAAELRDLIQSMEWYGTRCNVDIAGCEDEEVCPVCDASQDEGHRADCRLAHMLQVDGPARGHAILDELRQLRRLRRLTERCCNPYLDGEYSTYTQADALYQLEVWLRDHPQDDQAAQREADGSGDT